MAANKACQGKSSDFFDDDKLLWNEAIAGAERELETIEKRAGELRSAIKTFEGHRDRGYRWPGADRGTH